MWGIGTLMLRQSQIDKIQRGLKKAHDLLAGDVITHVSAATAIETEILCIFSSLDQESFKGLQADHSGILDNAIYEVQFEKLSLDAANIEINPADWFIKDGKRLEFAKSEDIKEYVVPICAIHNFIIVRLVDSVQINHTTSGDTWTIE
jgi:hypothetical protein